MVARLVILITAPFVLGFTFIASVVSGIRMAFVTAWLDCCIEVESIRPYWKAKNLRKVSGNE